MDSKLNIIMFASAVIVELVYLVLFILTIKRPGFRFWPPPGPRSWQFFTAWLGASLVAVLFILLGLLDFDTFFLPTLMKRAPAALVCLLIGSAIGTWAFFEFGLRNTIGLGNRLVTSGPYKYSRNPQYIGDAINILGYMLFTNSRLVWGIGLLGIMLNALAPLTEEPWLEAKFGQPYLDYKGRVPRFVGWKSKDKTNRGASEG